MQNVAKQNSKAENLQIVEKSLLKERIALTSIVKRIQEDRVPKLELLTKQNTHEARIVRLVSLKERWA
jgi:hypothetical protein